MNQPTPNLSINFFIDSETALLVKLNKVLSVMGLNRINSINEFLKIESFDFDNTKFRTSITVHCGNSLKGNSVKMLSSVPAYFFTPENEDVVISCLKSDVYSADNFKLKVTNTNDLFKSKNAYQLAATNGNALVLFDKNLLLNNRFVTVQIESL